MLINGALFAAATESRHFNDFAPEMDMGKAETAPHKPAVAKQRIDLFRPGIGCDVKVLGFATQQKITNTTTDKVCLITRVVEPV